MARGGGGGGVCVCGGEGGVFRRKAPAWEAASIRDDEAGSGARSKEGGVMERWSQAAGGEGAAGPSGR